MRLAEVTLSGQLVRLEPLGLKHVPDLVAHSSEERGSFGWTLVPEGQEAMERYVLGLRQAYEAGQSLPFAQVRLPDESAVGATRFLSLRARPEGDLYALEVGGTWLGAQAQGTGINLEAKFLLLEHAFERLGVARVDIKTDARNQKARRAILG